MYGLPDDFDASVFIKKEVNQICFAINAISLSFDDDIVITIMDSFIHMESPDVKANQQTLPILSSNLMSLIGKVVCHAEGCKDGTLTLEFGNEHKLIILDDSEYYESYIIGIGNKEIIV